MGVPLGENRSGEGTPDDCCRDRIHPLTKKYE